MRWRLPLPLLVLANVQVASAQEPPDTNYDESKVPTYELPDLLGCFDGRDVTDAEMWRGVRRPEILQAFATHIYGRTPTIETRLRFETLSTEAEALGGLATRKEVRIRLFESDDAPWIDLLLYAPNGVTRPAPAFLGLNYGNQGVHPDPTITPSRNAVCRRGEHAHRWPLELLLKRGYAVAGFHGGDIELDRHGSGCRFTTEGWRKGVRHYVRRQEGRSEPADDGWGSIGVWAWGLSRALDYLQTDPDVDGERVAVFGHSRTGKTALWAGAQDERFAFVISNNSGQGGASLARRRYGESIAASYSLSGIWYCRNYEKYGNNEPALPVDAHMLIASIAPRPVYVASAEEDRWSDPRGEFLAAHHADPVYWLLGRPGLGALEMPPVNQPVGETVGYHIRTGDHEITPYDWERYLDFADLHLVADSGSDGIASRVDHWAAVSLANLIYDAPAGRPVEGHPIGNGRMGTMVWTTPEAVHLQINRNDVFAVNRNHAGDQFAPTDICGGCASVVVDVGGTPFASGQSFEQLLSLYDAEAQVIGEAIKVRCFVASHTDVLVLAIDDRREEPQPIRVVVSMWRDPEVAHGAHSVRYRFSETEDRLLVVQAFEEKDHHCESAVAVRLREAGVEIRRVDQRTRAVVAPARRGERTVFIASAASLGREQAKEEGGVAEEALAVLQAVDRRSYDELRWEHLPWWHRFWTRTFVQLTSDDGAAEAAQKVRYRHLYYMASSSRGRLPPKWNGSLFATAGDERQWGSQFWVWTTEMLYFPLAKADAIDLTDPYFDMYVRQLPNCERAARQRWGSRGAYFPETTAFDGPTVLPDDVAAEFQDVLFGRKPPAELSSRAFAMCRFDSHLRAATEPQKGRYSWISHVASSGSELAAQAWWRFRITGDTQWLRTHAYPLLRGTVEFYRHLVKKDQDGLYHLSGTNAHEDFWGVKDGIMDLAAIRGTAPLAIRAAEILSVDEDLRGEWRELLDNLAPYPMGNHPRAKELAGGVLADDVWAAGYLGDVDGQNNPEDVWLNPVFPFEDWTLETRDVAVDRIVQKALDLAPRHASVLNGAKLSTAIRTPIAVVRAGRGEDLPAVLASYYAAFSPLPNGMSLFEGPTAPSIEHLGLLTTTLQDALVQSVSPRPGEPEVIRLFPAWPRQWQASFRLLVRGGFLVSAAAREGEVELVKIHSRRGERCRLRNPWGRSCDVIGPDGGVQVLSGDILRFNTRPEEAYRVVPHKP